MTNEDEVVICAGSPTCLLQDEEAIKNAQDGCPLCRRIIIHADGTETEYRRNEH